MHGRIIQIERAPINPNEFIKSSYFDEHWFVGSVADYVTSSDREDDIQWLRNYAGIAFDFKSDDTFVLHDGGKESFFKHKFQEFQHALATLHGITLNSFCEFNIDLEMKLFLLNDTYNSERGFYVVDDDNGISTLDEWVRSAEYGVLYYIGGTLDYHS